MKLYTKAYILVISILIQNIVVILLSNRTFIGFLDDSMEVYKYPLLIAVFINILGFIGIMSVYYIIMFLKKEKTFLTKISHSEEVIDALQGQKHDFNNHLNVLAGMLQLGRNKKALEYIFSISEKVEEVFSISKIKNVEIAATLYRKCAIAESKGIEVDLYIESDLEKLKIDPIDMSKILFNLIDNAVHELEKSQENEKILSIDIHERDQKYYISIGNSYPVLPGELYDKVFVKGFSTKKSGTGHGYGLSIVKSIVEKNSGEVSVESFEGVGTVFTVCLPMSQDMKEVGMF